MPDQDKQKLPSKRKGTSTKKLKRKRKNLRRSLTSSAYREQGVKWAMDDSTSRHAKNPKRAKGIIKSEQNFQKKGHSRLNKMDQTLAGRKRGNKKGKGILKQLRNQNLNRVRSMTESNGLNYQKNKKVKKSKMKKTTDPGWGSSGFVKTKRKK